MNRRMKTKAHRVRHPRFGSVLFFVLLVLSFTLHPSSFAFASDYNVDTDYRNWWFTPSPSNGPYSNYFGAGQAGVTNASTAVYHGNALGNTNDLAPSNAAFRLMSSSFGQAVEGLKADVALGEVIPPPTGVDTNVAPANFAAVRVGNNPAAYYECQDPVGGAFWVPSTKQVIAAQPNNIEIHWRTTGGTTNIQVMMVGAVPLHRPARLYWTETPYDAPTVNLYGLFPVIHYNSEIQRPEYQITTNVQGGVTNISSNVVSGVWLDGQKHLHATEMVGMFVLEYYETGTYDEQIQPVGIEIVQVMEPDVMIQQADIGERLLPQDTYWSQKEGDADLDAYVSKGLNDTSYRFDHVGPKQGWVYSIKKTVDEPWSLEIYWRHSGVMDVLWPFEYDWYECDWPVHPQLRVISASTQTTAAVVVPGELTAQLMDYMDPPLHAELSVSGKSLMMTEPGYCLMKYSTHDDIWFEVVKSVERTNSVFFDLTPLDWDIGEELRPSGVEAHTLAFDGVEDYVGVGTSWIDKQTNWTISLWFQPEAGASGALYGEGDRGATFEIDTSSSGGIHVGIWNEDVAGRWEHFYTPNHVVKSNMWQRLAVTLENGDDASNGTLRVYLDDQSWVTTNMSRLNYEGPRQTLLAAGIQWPTGAQTNFFHGRMDEVRVWNRALTADEIASNRYELVEGDAAGLVANYEFDEGTGDIVHNEAGSYDGTAYNGPVWCYGQINPAVDFASFPGYLYQPFGNRYNINRYDYPTEDNPDVESHLFAVNTNTLEVWWANRTRQVGMPAVYYPSWVNRYDCHWPTGMPQIVIASRLGSNGDQMENTDSALDFNGTTDYVMVSNSPLLEMDGEVTVEAWVRLDAAINSKIVSHADVGASDKGFILGVGNATCYPELWDDEGNHFFCEAGSVPTGIWTHLAFTYQTGQYFSAYVNGRQVYQTAASDSPISAPAADLIIGRASWSDGFHVNGRIGEVRIWNVARTPSEIASFWLARPQGDEEGLLAYYPFERGTNDAVLADGGTLGLDGVKFGAEWVEPGRPVPVASQYLLSDDSIYVQNDAARPGYNPNEEHALVLGGVAYALRDDLNATNQNGYTSSAPFVMVDYLDPDTARPKMALFGVVRTNRQYRFEYPLEAGLPIQPPMPLGAMPLCANTTSLTQPPAWRDRKLGWWARSAGDDGGETNALMQFFYQMQPGFWFPGVSASGQPSTGQELPWLPSPSFNHGTTGTPLEVTYDLTWPENVPEMKIAQTLTVAAQGLPDLWSQLSVQSIYQQSAQTGHGNSVTLFDPVVDQGADLSNDVVQAMIDSDLARHDLTDAKTRFPGLPPSLYPRLFYDPDRGEYGQLVLEGVYEETLTGSGYLLLNLLVSYEKTQVKQAAEGIDSGLKDAWDAAVETLPHAVTNILPNKPYVHAAAYAGMGTGTGFVTLAFNNSTNPVQVPPALPVSLSIFRVVPELYEGTVEVLEPEDVLDEQLNLRTSLDFGGQVQDYEFEWHWENPVGGLIPNTNYSQWNVYGADPAAGSNEVTIAGASPFTLEDHYFAVRYRMISPSGPTGTNWSEWTYNLAPGWVQRVMNGINPFEQCLQDTLQYAVDTRSTMISLAGPPYEGDIALNLQAACEGGLIPVYQTVMNRAQDFSILAGADRRWRQSDPAVCRQPAA